jgi:hypothetical protein
MIWLQRRSSTLCVRVADRSPEVIMGRSCFAKYSLAGNSVHAIAAVSMTRQPVEEPPLSVPVHRIIGRIEVENDSFGARLCASRKRSTDNRDR